MSSDTLGGTEARKQLFEVMDRDVPFERKAERALEIGEAYLDVENGHVTRIDPEFDYWEAIASSDPPNGEFPPGLTLDLQTTYCRRTIAQDGSITLHDAPNQGWADDPAYETHGLDCYHGSTLTVDGDTYGTICFVAADPRGEPFDESETLFAELVARLLEHALATQRHEAELGRRERLINVLSRVLRHNIRNDISVIRGRVERLSGRDDLSEDIDAITTKTEELVAVSDKARTLESVLRSDFEYNDVTLPAYIHRIVENVAPEYPTASFIVEETEPITISVMPSLNVAIRELLDNAAKHAGSEPEVTVGIDISEAAVEIHIVDTGPGLPEQEREVLDSGVETPLTHGSGLGLWLVYWTVTSHNGTVETTVTADGTRVTIRLPPYTADIGVDAIE